MADNPQAQQKILGFLAKQPRGRFTPAELQHRAGFARGDLQAVTDALRQLCRDGRVVRLKKNHYALPDRQNLLRGRVHAHPDGYGFLIVEDKDVEDVYLNRREMRRVMHGDQVLVRIDRKARGASEAHIVQVIEHAQKRLLGTYEKIDGRGFLIPMDARIGPLPLKTAGTKLTEGQVVAAEISRFGTAMSPPEAAVVQVMGDADDPEVQAQAIIFRFGLSASFPPEVHREVKDAAFDIDAEEIARREDLRELPIVTIDGENARDFDDAIYVRRLHQGYQLLVSIADVSHYVRPDTALDREAYARSTSVYFPDRAIPMLPEALSNGICSLNPNEERLTKTACIDFNAKGEALHSRFFDSVIRSHARMTYTEVRRILVDNDAECLERYRDLVDGFKLMEELARLIFANRKARGNLDFDLPEAEIILDLQGLPENIVRAERNIAHRIIEEFMIAANEAVARELTAKDFPTLYRVHGGPDEDALEALEPFLLSLGYRLPENKENLPPLALQRLLESARGKPEERVVNRVLLRSMKQAVYQPENIGHFGLASTCYTHFTSPIRRYPDLIVHRMLARVLAGAKLKAHERADLLRQLQESGKHTSERERHAMDAERDMVDLKKAQFMMTKMGEEFNGFVNSLVKFGLFIELDDYFVEGLVKLSSLTDDDYEYYEKEYLIKGRRHGRKFRLGDNLRVRVAKINAFRSEIDFELVQDDWRG